MESVQLNSADSDALQQVICKALLFGPMPQRAYRSKCSRQTIVLHFLGLYLCKFHLPGRELHRGVARPGQTAIVICSNFRRSLPPEM
eukprot:1194167-Prorocentrum_minimum.AAC.3